MCERAEETGVEVNDIIANITSSKRDEVLTTQSCHRDDDRLVSLCVDTFVHFLFYEISLVIRTVEDINHSQEINK